MSVFCEAAEHLLKLKEGMKKYNVVYADPPWDYDNKTTGRTNGNQPEGSGAATKYNTLDQVYLFKMPLNELTEKDAVCFMWVVNPLLPEGLQLLKAWGFEYKTMLTWKKNTGTGYWFIGRTEHLLLGVKGNVKAFRSGLIGFHECKSGKHSAKPHHFRNIISEAVKNSFDEPKKLELFARTREGMFGNYEYEGWDVFGNEVENSIRLPNNERMCGKGQNIAANGRYCCQGRAMTAGKVRL